MNAIPFNAASAFTETVVLGNKQWIFGFVWNTRFQFWTMSVSNASGIIIDGIRLVPNLLLLASHAKDNLPSGDFLVWSPGSTTNLIQSNNLGIGLDYELWYFEPSEVTSYGLI